jgi:hypothetical protein
MEVSGQFHSVAALTAEEILDKGASGPQIRSGLNGEENISNHYRESNP